MDNKIKSFRDLNIWSKGTDLVKDVYSITEVFPVDEKYGLTSQMRRASVSIPSSIAEGSRRNHNKEYRQFLHIALGSCAELETRITIAKELKFINKEREVELSNRINQLCRMTMSLVKKL